MEKETDRSQKNMFIFISVLLLAFCVTKILRGGNVGSTETGGIWNLISLAYYPLAFFALFRKEHSLKTVFTAPAVYVFFTLLSVIINFTGAPDINSIYQILMIPYFLLVFVVFYCYSCENKKAHYIILIAFFACLLLNLINVVEYQFFGAKRALASDIYYSLSLFPFALLLTKKKLIKILAVSGMFFAVFFSNKRTGIIAFVIALIIYIVVNVYVNNPRNFANTIKSLILVAVIILALYYAGRYFDNKYDLGIFARLENLREDGGSGRTEIYSAIWKAYQNSSFFDKIIGHGLFATNSLTGFNAHDDFLEILYDYGIFALIIIVVFYFALFTKCVNMVRKRSPYAAAFSASLIIGVFLSLFSYFIVYYTYVTCSMAFWGYCLAMDKRFSESKSINRNIGEEEKNT